MFEMDPKQREWSVLQPNFILQMTGLGNAAAAAKCLECHWKVTHCNRTLLCTLCIAGSFNLTSLSLFIIQVEIFNFRYYKTGVIHRFNQVAFTANKNSKMIHRNSAGSSVTVFVSDKECAQK